MYYEKLNALLDQLKNLEYKSLLGKRPFLNKMRLKK